MLLGRISATWENVNMSDRLEYSGDPLPSGLPGFGGGTVDVLILPGFNRVVAPQKFGPVNNAPTVTPPDPTPPPGSNPEVPTPPNEVVPPAPAPTPPSTGNNNFCKACTPPTSNVGDDKPLLFGRALDTGCTNCAGTKPGQITWFDTASNGSEGIFLYEGVQGLECKGTSNWKLDASEGRATLYLDDLEMTSVRGGGPSITGPDGNEYAPQELEVCEGGQPKKWKVLAYKPS